MKMHGSKTGFVRSVIVGSLALLCATFSSAQQLAFPTAEGYGKYVTGGRGGAVYEVTNLNATGTGSLGAAIAASGPRTVVFRVAGTITGDFNITNNDITIAGQTAPGDGICIKGNLTTSASNIIIRYIRVRHDPDVVGDALGGRYQSNIIFDHVSTSWSADEVLSLYHNNSNTTVQWCIIAQGCEKFENGVSVGHRFGGIWGNNYGTWHHNLIAHNDSRNPRWASGCGYNDYRNNVIYNWGYESCYGGEKDQPALPQFSGSYINMIANYYKAGPATIANQTAARTIAQPSARSSTDKGDWYVSGNYFDGQSDITANNWVGVLGSDYNKLSSPWNAMAINQQTPQAAYLSVLEKVGCSFPKRDKVDADIISDVQSGTAKYGNKGIISKPSDVGGWPIIASGTAPADSDHDGMPDSWETVNGLDPNNAADRNNIGAGGYTMLEVYLNSLVDAAPAGSSNIVWGPVQNIMGDTDVSTTGTLVRAANLTKSGGSYDANVTLNGVTFERAPYAAATTTLANGDTLVTSDISAVGAYEGFGGATAPFSSLSTNYQSLLRSGHYNDGDLANTAGTARVTLTLKNLTVGTKYQVQIWVNDYRVVNMGQSNPGLVTTVADSAGGVTLEQNVNNALGGKGQYVIGTFTANATSKVITLTGGNTGTDTSAPNCSSIWNAYQLRVVP